MQPTFLRNANLTSLLVVLLLLTLAACKEHPQKPNNNTATPDPDNISLDCKTEKPCQNRSCGIDPCGYDCGNCGVWHTCVNGLCRQAVECTPNCKDRQCGSNSCGGTCGICAPSQTCVKHKCINECQPYCHNKTCGSDGCGSSCGTCKEDEICQNHKCVKDIVECIPRCGMRKCGDDGCGGTCGTCAPNETCNMYNFQCVKTNDNVVKGKIFLEIKEHEFDETMRLSLSKISTVPAKNIIVSLVDKDHNLLSAAEIRSNGAFYIYLDRPPREDDALMISASWTPESAKQPKLIGLKADTSPENYTPWTWKMQLSDFAVPPRWGQLQDITIKISQASGALYIFQFLQDAMKTTLADLFLGNPEKLPSLAFVWKEGIQWKCGSCFIKLLPQVINGKRIADQTIFIGGEPNGESAWGFPTTLHEFGHYVAAMARDDSKGGKHFLGDVQDPPLAWSEGWASFFAVMTMSRFTLQPQPIYWRKLPNTSFWIDYSLPISSLLIQKPNLKSDQGIRQKLDETWVSHMLWDLWDGDDVPELNTQNDDQIALGTKTCLAALFQKRYLHYDRGYPGSDFLDYIDSILCMYPTLEADLTKMLRTIQHFPYDAKPQCTK